MVIARGETSNTRLTDATVSRLHCELHWDGGHFRLVDLDSVGGTLVDGKKIKEHALKHHQEFQRGSRCCRVGETHRSSSPPRPSGGGFHPPYNGSTKLVEQTLTAGS